MAIFKNFTVVNNGIRYSSGETNTGLVVNPLDGDLWIDSQPYDADTLYPLFSKPCTALKNNKVYEAVANGFVVSAIVAKGPCLLNGQDTGTAELGPQNTYILGSRDHNLEDDKTLAMSSNLFRFTSTAGAKMNLLTLPYGTSAYYSPKQKYAFIEGDDFSNPAGVIFGEYGILSTTYDHGQKWPVHVDITNKYIYFISTHGYNNNSVYYKTLRKNVTRASYTTNADDGTLTLTEQTEVLSFNNGTVYGGGYVSMETNGFYYCGKNLNDSLMFLETVEIYTPNYAQQSANWENRSDEIFNAESYKSGTGVVASVATLGKSSLSDGTVAAKTMLRPRPTQFIVSPIAGEGDVFYAYYPVADANYEVSFLMLKWDKSANTNEGSLITDNCTMIYGSGVVTDYLQYPLRSTTDTGTQARSNSFITMVGSDYFLHYLPSYSSPTSVATQPALAKNLVTYQINATDFSRLTYHSSFQANACDFVHLNSARTKIAVITSGALKVYTWNNGWVETASESGDFIGVTQDDKGRIIGVAGSANNPAAATNSVDSAYSMIPHRIHLISDSLPSTVTVTFASSSLTYTGLDLATTINVSAYDTASARIAKLVDLKIDGANAVFDSNTGTSRTATTLATGELSVALTITGPGPLTISAAFAI